MVPLRVLKSWSVIRGQLLLSSGYWFEGYPSLIQVLHPALELCGGLQAVCGEGVGLELGPGGGGDHGGVVGCERERGEGDGEIPFCGLGGEALAELTVGGDTTRDDDGFCAEGFGGGEGSAEEVVDDGALEAGDEVEGGFVAEGEDVGEFGFGDLCEECFAARGDAGRLHGVGFDVAEDGGLDAGERKI